MVAAVEVSGRLQTDPQSASNTVFDRNFACVAALQNLPPQHSMHAVVRKHRTGIYTPYAAVCRHPMTSLFLGILCSSCSIRRRSSPAASRHNAGVACCVQRTGRSARPQLRTSARAPQTFLLMRTTPSAWTNSRGHAAQLAAAGSASCLHAPNHQSTLPTNTRTARTPSARRLRCPAVRRLSRCMATRTALPATPRGTTRPRSAAG